MELHLLGWTLILAVVQILLPAMWRNRETGVEYNAGPRDKEGPPMGKVTGRLFRAQRNLFETLPLFIAAVLIVHITHQEGAMTLWGCWLYLLARIVYVPLYALGIPWVRSLVYMVSMFGLLLLLLAVVF
ncbi:MAPEG family protein [Larsenimonas suaedae]|uniref:MAPEG family protein n=1 Tax=Larsenimonas suaedae TaxID=1851019 RepID=A0ABU1GW67_9GAMM|nr:MAPEG family protein [Larsenimonas suaedae]MCM2973403.1 MAPEG family protein [Larsenimonas suaedae]MDR5896296.1 MAPEG family protein [Larsenimonas suaedae]